MDTNLKAQIKELENTIERLVEANATDKVIGRLEVKRQELIKKCNLLNTEVKTSTRNESTDHLKKELKEIDRLLQTTSQNVKHSAERFDRLITRRFEIVDALRQEEKQIPNKKIIENLKKLSERDADFINRMRRLGNRFNSIRSEKCPVCETRYWTLPGQPVECCCTLCQEEYTLNIKRAEPEECIACNEEYKPRANDILNCCSQECEAVAEIKELY